MGGWDDRSTLIQRNFKNMSVITWSQLLVDANETGSGQWSRTRALQHFGSQAKAKGWTELVLPAGLVIKPQEPIWFDSTKVGIRGEGTALGGNQAKFKVQILNATLRFPVGARLQNLSFVADPQMAPWGTVEIGGRNEMNNEDDTDGSIENCTFNVGGYNIGIRYNGRNCNIYRNSFSDGTQCTAVHLAWDGIVNEGGDSLTHGSRKNRINDNQIHLARSSRAIVAGGDFPIHDCQIKNNTLDIGCQLLKTIKAGGTFSITENTWLSQAKSWGHGSEGVVEFSEGRAQGVVANNIFDSTDRINSDRVPRFVRVRGACDSGASITFSGNQFLWAKKGEYAVKVSSANHTCSAFGGAIKNGDANRRGVKGCNWTSNVFNIAG